MEVQELRIGNYVNLFDIQEQVTIIEIGEMCKIKDGHEVSFYHIEDLTPIPLTEQWLLKFGFKKYGTFHESYILYPFLIEWQEVYKNYVFRKRIKEYESIYLTNLKHIHQLQNLYFALTGTELTINQK